MKVEIEINSPEECPYRNYTYDKCDVEGHEDMNCYDIGKSNFPSGCPLLALNIKQTNDSIKFIE